MNTRLRLLFFKIQIKRRFWLVLWVLFWAIEDLIEVFAGPGRDRTRIESRIWPILLIKSRGHL